MNSTEPFLSEESPKSLKVEELAEALLRCTLPEAERIIQFSSSTVIDSDEDRHRVATQLAEICRHRQHQLRDVIHELNQRMGGLDRTLVNCLVFMNRATEKWQKSSPLAPYVKKQVLKRRYILAALVLDQPEFAIDPLHPINQLLVAIEKLFLGWEEEQGQPPVFVSKALAALTRLLDDDNCLIRSEQVLARDTLYQQWEKEESRRKKLESRLIQSELGQDKASFARSISVETINRFAASKSLPSVVISFLGSTWFEHMRSVAISHGGESDKFAILQKLTDRIVFCFRAGLNQAQKKRFINYAGQLIDELIRQMEEVGSLNQTQENQLSEMQMLMIELIQENEIERVPFEGLISANKDQSDEAKLIDSRLAESELKQVSAFQGAWFRRFGKVCKLLTVLPLSYKILWSDFNGRKAALEDSAIFWQDLQAGNADKYEGQAIIHQVFCETAENLILEDTKQREQIVKQLEREKEIRIAAKRKAEAEALAIRKAALEAKKKREQERRETEERLKREAIKEAERQKLEQEASAREQLDELPIGGWVLVSKNGAKTKCKLGVRLNATGRLIFVDNFGMKVAEVYRDEAVQLICSKEIEILGKGAELEDRLSRAAGRIGIAKR